MFGWLAKLLGVRGRHPHAPPNADSLPPDLGKDQPPVKLIVGLGNPGAEYQRTRHNVGFMVADWLASRCSPAETPKVRFKSLAVEARLPDPGDAFTLPTDPFGGLRTLLLKPTTYMNLSGQAVAEAVRFYKLNPTEDVLVIVDDVALPCGAIRLRAKGGAGGHNGLANIQQLLGTQEYSRLRIGIDPPGDFPQRDYVLGKFSPDQHARIDDVLPKAAACCALWAHHGAIAAMNRFNASDATKQPKHQPTQRHADQHDDDANSTHSTPAPRAGPTHDDARREAS
jgi:PTH1 family peptidyl-tRNA hydrolase